MAEEEAPDVAASALTDATASGYLDKKRPEKRMMSIKYHKRWCVIKDGTFYYFEKPTDKRQKGSFPLDGFVFASSELNSLAFSLNKFGKRGYEFMTSSIQEFTKWRNAITQAMRHGKSTTADWPNRKKSMDIPVSSSDRPMSPMMSPRVQHKKHTIERTQWSSSVPKSFSSMTSDAVPRRGKSHLTATTSLPSAGTYRSRDCDDYANIPATENPDKRIIKHHPKIGVISKNSVEEEEDVSEDDDYLVVLKGQSVPEKRKHGLKDFTSQDSSFDEEENFYQNLPHQQTSKQFQEEEDDFYLQL